ncbi:BZ3500_MvSof-1268-A1-R1_Chr3-1g05488 [Microbotryum saponariae]|uniref:BZ3500_MvSof-1268-A1-R1_Chr3-1g05488 protein n=1 Tax=Microbotryum saponariae TaxID=289078 RepID=A0A2X0LFR6_9BASI|nr:BZ3500_MvSof-1268-A1-R1_Chr3-1g05488 [Microbotryum saponariae]SDA04679.1 BZ3501_MvSof-1269-A2-R1_Chr3-1g05159 [Microbotryum saponariae]
MEWSGSEWVQGDARIGCWGNWQLTAVLDSGARLEVCRDPGKTRQRRDEGLVELDFEATQRAVKETRNVGELDGFEDEERERNGGGGGRGGGRGVGRRGGGG